MTTFRFNDAFQNKGKLKLRRATIVTQQKFLFWHYFLVTKHFKMQKCIGIIMYLLLVPFVLSFKKEQKRFHYYCQFYQK